MGDFFYMNDGLKKSFIEGTLTVIMDNSILTFKFSNRSFHSNIKYNSKMDSSLNIQFDM